jgi:hypothetical protein
MAVTLPGARVAWVFALEPGTLHVEVIARVPPYLSAVPVLVREHLAFDESECALARAGGTLRAVALLDGNILITGRVDGAGVACIVDPGRGELVPDVRAAPERAGVARTPLHLVALADGVIAELDAQGTTLRRETLARSGPGRIVTPFDSPPTTLSDEGLAFDAPGRWERSGAFATARDHASRVDLPTLRFDAFDAELEATGGRAELLLLPSDAPPVAVVLFDAGAGPSLCEVERVEGAALSVRRRGTRLTISAGGESRVCTVPGARGSLGLAVRASEGTTFRALRVSRL